MKTPGKPGCELHSTARGGRILAIAYPERGTPNDDVAKFSATLEKVDGGWKIVHLHRGTGQKPS